MPANAPTEHDDAPDQGVGRTTAEPSRWPSLVVAAGRLAGRHPVAAVFTVAVAARVTLAMVIRVGHHGVLIPDESQYVGLAAALARGHRAVDWDPVYGNMLLRSTWAFTAPVAALTFLVRDARLAGQLLAALMAAAVAGMVTWLTRALGPSLAILAGMLVALFPSQVFWSSVILRESTIWAALALIATGVVVTTLPSRRSFVIGSLLLMAGIAPLGWLRGQTMVAAVWALAATALLLRDRRWLPRLGVVGAITVVLPLLAGLGVAGIGLARDASGSLAATRAYMALDARSGITPTTVYVDKTPGGSPGKRRAGATGAREIAARAGGTITVDGKQRGVIQGEDGALYAFDTGAGANLRHLPTGLIGSFLKPWPWSGASNGMRAAGLEAPAWLALYVLAAIGAVAGFRRQRAIAAFPAALVGSIGISAALTEGNLGTAFRHRGQLLWCIVVLAAVGVWWLRERRQPSAEAA